MKGIFEYTYSTWNILYHFTRRAMITFQNVQNTSVYDDMKQSNRGAKFLSRVSVWKSKEWTNISPLTFLQVMFVAKIFHNLKWKNVAPCVSNTKVMFDSRERVNCKCFYWSHFGKSRLPNARTIQLLYILVIE